MKTLPKKFLGQLLVESFMITQMQLENALHAQREQGGRLAALLFQLGYLKPSKFCEFMAKQPGVASIRVGAYPVDHALVELVPRAFAESREVFPLDRLGNLLTVAMVCPLDLATMQELEQMTGLRVKPLLCEPGDLYAAIRRYYPEPYQESLPVPVAVHGDRYAALARSNEHVSAHAPERTAQHVERRADKRASAARHTSGQVQAVFDFLPPRTQAMHPHDFNAAKIVPFSKALARKQRLEASSTVLVLHCSPCSSCGHETPDSASGYRYCGHCGAELASNAPARTRQRALLSGFNFSDSSCTG